MLPAVGEARHQRAVCRLVVGVDRQQPAEAGRGLLAIAGDGGDVGHDPQSAQTGGSCLLPQRRRPLGVRVVLERFSGPASEGADEHGPGAGSRAPGLLETAGDLRQEMFDVDVDPSEIESDARRVRDQDVRHARRCPDDGQQDGEPVRGPERVVVGPQQLAQFGAGHDPAAT